MFDGKEYSQTSNRIIPVPNYNIFDPTELNTDQWIRSVKAAGAKFALLTVTHETGFALYQSDVNPYCLKALKWRHGKGDIVRDFVNSCRKYGWQPGLYIGIRWNSFFGVHDFKAAGSDKTFVANRQHYLIKWWKEWCVNFVCVTAHFLKSGLMEVLRIREGGPRRTFYGRKISTRLPFYWNSQHADARWGGSESGTVGYPSWATFPFPSTDQQKYPKIGEDNNALLKHGDSLGKYWMPPMADAPLRGYNGRHEWFWEPGDDPHVFLCWTW